MGRLERYILGTAGVAFIAALLTLTAMVWLTQVLRRFDLLTSQGQTILVFLKVTALALPMLLMVIAPIALFLAAAYALNKLNGDSELVVMSAAGLGPWQLFRPLLALTLLVAAISGAISTDIGPYTLRKLRDQIAQVNADIVTNVAVPGRFTTIERGLTFHVRERAPGGVLLGIFVNDQRNAENPMTYIADRGRIISSDSGGMFLLLEQGSVHKLAGRNSSIVEFERYAFDLSQFTQSTHAGFYRPSDRTLWELLNPPEDDPLLKQEPGRFRLELHKRLSAPLYPIAAFIIAFAFLGAPCTTRQSRGLAIAGAITAFTAVEIAGFGASGFVARSELAAPLPYLIPLAAIVIGLLFIAGYLKARVPAPLQRLADAVVARIERLQTA
jgi:lipopolysaccharide export system permease protein